MFDKIRIDFTIYFHAFGYQLDSFVRIDVFWTSDGLFVGGYDGTSPGYVNTVEIWDGTAVSSGTNYPVSRDFFASNGSGTAGGNASRGGGYAMANNGPGVSGESNFWISE